MGIFVIGVAWYIKGVGEGMLRVFASSVKIGSAGDIFEIVNETFSNFSSHVSLEFKS